MSLLIGREHLSAYVDYDNYEAATTTTEPGDDDNTRHRQQQQQQQQSTSRLYNRAAAAAGSDVIGTVMQCNQPTERGNV